ncbi:MAG: two-component system response regulator CreB, partial [Burkholderiaceae bacterium]|nr:two-component system response regulator CreB [Burkholderiaceae bacterium]
MPHQRILVVEDEPAIADTIVYALSSDGFDPHWCATGGAALEAARGGGFALAVL